MKGRLKRFWKALWRCEPVEIRPPPPDESLVAAIKTVGWCIFWGLVLHGCLTGHNTIRLVSK